jgi:hypothetical protein
MNDITRIAAIDYEPTDGLSFSIRFFGYGVLILMI